MRKNILVLMFTLGLVVAASTLQPASAFGQATVDRVTFNRDVLPILQKNCQTCHRPGEIGPMSFLTYESTRPLGEGDEGSSRDKKDAALVCGPEIWSL